MEEERVEFEKMEGFHKLKSLWRIEYKAVTLEPLLTQAASEEAKEIVDSVLGKSIPKDLPDAVPLVFEGKAVITGNAVKGVFRHLISSQLREAGVRACIQRVKGGPTLSSEQYKECPPDDPCFVCTWFGTPSRQGALHFGLLRSVEGLDKVLAGDPIPLIAIREDYGAIDPKARAFLLLAPVKENVEFKGWVKGENLSEEVIGAIKEAQDMSEKGFVQFGGHKTRGFGSVKLEVLKIEKYKTVPFELEKTFEGDKLKEFLKACQGKYHGLLARGKKS
ncbi:MAG: RAMP superfamily CRISPR-associated protein [Thermoproteota archaeon]